MKKLYVLAALLMATTTAHAGNSVSFEINGNRIHIEVPRNCDALSCMQISAPGLSGSGFGADKSDRFDDEPDRLNDKPDRFSDKSDRFNDKSDRFNEKSDRFSDKSDRNDKPNRFGGRFNRFNNKSDRADDNDVAARSDQPAPNPTSASAASDAASASTPVASNTPSPAATNDVAPATRAPVAVANVAPTSAAAPVEALTTPIGVWATEENKGNVQVEPCGPNLCGYAVKTGEKILINMKPSDTKWTGRIHDPDSGRNYDSTIAMKGPNAMRVQGCAFGGMFCGGQTWKRVS
jgi:uncharacterized protein (DUF2147 family)